MVDISKFVYSELLDTEKFYGNPFCKCDKKMACTCNGKEITCYDWCWDAESATASTVLRRNNLEVHFHPSYSSGTAAVRGNRPLQQGNVYYWEIKMLTPLYGTDVMVGVGTKKVQLDKYAHQFCSLMGSDAESWGFSYTGSLHHNGRVESYGPPFGKGSTIGIYLDMWEDTLEFFLDRRPLGIAFQSLRACELYPIVCSTAAQSAMRITCCISQPVSLKLLSLRALSTYEESFRYLLDVPGLRKYIADSWWMPVVTRSQKISDEVAREDYLRAKKKLKDDVDGAGGSSTAAGADCGLPPAASCGRFVVKRKSRPQEPPSLPFTCSL
ncbi:SPRY domain-containing SOCS box protein 3 [Nilaparvata lugens]|uniref:SPRY domain-containing SOCS box protein 3 n=1 Tax=Nilaparvata lugens TaxID=108931 RepID=UPI000B991530|nr:SPRY domain-containing SOCS box protein 3 [Nilaparvata lugens]